MVLPSLRQNCPMWKTGYSWKHTDANQSAEDHIKRGSELAILTLVRKHVWLLEKGRWQSSALPR